MQRDPEVPAPTQPAIAALQFNFILPWFESGRDAVLEARRMFASNPDHEIRTWAAVPVGGTPPVMTFSAATATSWSTR